VTKLYESFRIINDFVKDVWGFDLIKKSINPSIARIKELKNAYKAIMDIICNQRKPFPNEFVKYVYPLLEVSVQWAELKKKGRLTKAFLEKCKQKFNPPKRETFYGSLFEIDIVSRCLLSNWDIDFVEDLTREGKQQIDFVFRKKNEVIGVECLSKRYTQKYGNLTIDKINEDIKKKARKFRPEFIKELGHPLDKKLLIIDITTDDYSQPKILNNLERGVSLGGKLDGVVFTWREDVTDGKNHSLRAKYKILGNIDKRYFSVTYAAEFRITSGGPVFFMRKYVEPEPKVIVGSEETK